MVEELHRRRAHLNPPLGKVFRGRVIALAGDLCGEMSVSRARAVVAAFLVAVSLSGLGAATPALGSTTPAPAGPPWDAFTLEGTGGYVAGWAVFAWTPANSNWSFDPATGHFFAEHNSYEHWWHADTAPPTGQQFVAGTTYPALRFADSTHGRLDVYGDGRGCNQVVGSLTVLEAKYTEGQLTSFAAEYEHHCESNSAPATYGSLRWHSTVGFTGIAQEATQVSFPVTKVGATSSIDLVVGNGGSLPAHIGGATTDAPESFSVDAQACTEGTLSPGETCNVRLSFTPTTGGWSHGQVSVTSGDLRGGEFKVSLDGEAPIQAPGAPTDVTATADDGEATISWTAPVSNGGSPITEYTVTSTDGDTWQTNYTSLTATGLTNGTAYTFKVQARTAVGAGPWSLPSAPVVPLGVPDSPGSLEAIPGNRTVALSWAAPADDGGTPITGYTVRAYTYIDSAEDWVVVATQNVSEAVSTATITGLANGTEYVFEVTASNAVGEGWEAYVVSVPRTVPDAVTGVVAVAGDRQVTVSWSAPQSDGGLPITGYTVTSSSGGSWATSNTSLIVTGLVNGQEYSFTVAASNAAGAGPTSQASPRVTPQPPAPQQTAPQPPAPQQTAQQPPASVKVKATSKQSKLFVDVNPNKGSGYWKFQVQRVRTDGSWQFVKAYRTKGSKETRTINLPKGTYRVVVTPKYGYAEGTSAAVYLRR